MSTTAPRPTCARGVTHTVGLVICEITNPFYAELAAGIDDVLDQAGWVAFVANTAESPERQSRFIARMQEHRVDGILLAPAEGTAADADRRARRAGPPCGADAAPGQPTDRRLCQRRLSPRHDARRRASDPARARAYRLRRRRRGRSRRPRIEPRRSATILPRFGLPVGPIVNCLPTREGGAAAVAELFRGQDATRRPPSSATTTFVRSASCSASPTAASCRAATSP